MKTTFIYTTLFGLSLVIISGCNIQDNTSPADRSALPQNELVSEVEKPLIYSESITSENDVSDKEAENLAEKNTIEVITNPESVAVLVNNQYLLSEDYIPLDLVYPNVPFMFEEKIDKRKMRSEAANALEDLFLEAKNNGQALLGVSAYRSYQTQKALFNYYVERDGEEKARTYSAVPGQSEHQTGLAIDVVGESLTCLLEDCFADTEEGKWLVENAADFGFIIRYPIEKEDITGYQFEPWHLRYVGKEMAIAVTTLGFTLEEYMNAVPVSN
jgi:D-alanyl-D-alanine carboxypeptidase